MLDTSIPMRVNQVEGPAESYGKAMQIRNLANQGQAQQMALDSARQEQADKVKLADLYRNATDPTTGQVDNQKMMSGMAQAGQGAQIPAYQKQQAEAGKIKTEEEAKKYTLLNEKIKNMNASLSSLISRPNVTHQDIIQMMANNVQRGVITDEIAQADLKTLPGDPAQLKQWLMEKGMSGMEASKRIEAALPQMKSQNLGGTEQMVDMNPITNPGIVGQSFKKTTTPGERLSASTQMRGQNMASDRAKESIGVQRDRMQSPGRGGPMSVTLQKELLESDDGVQSSKAITSTLKEALKINDTAYSGYGAKGRAVISSNMPWQSKGADATISLDNMMTGQALESLKTVFGGMPTEGERKILLDMQASADKTPAQRKDIIERAIKAAERRGEYAKQKAQSIRSGSYLSEGMPQVDDSSNVDSLLEKYK